MTYKCRRCQRRFASMNLARAHHCSGNPSSDEPSPTTSSTSLESDFNTVFNTSSSDSSSSSPSSSDFSGGGGSSDSGGASGGWE